MDSHAPRKRPWELHAIACLFLLLLGAAISFGNLRRGCWEPEHLAVIAGMTVVLIGLFRGSLVAWWAGAAAFLILAVASTGMSVVFVREHGFRAHRIILGALATSALCVATFGLLLSSRLRSAYPPRAEPLFEDLLAFKKVLMVAAPLIFFLGALFTLGMVFLFETRRYHGDRNVATSLKYLSSAEADFRSNDRDWNQINDFWTGDVQGLYGLVPLNGKESIKLIELSMAAADGGPVKGAYPPIPATTSPKAGAWFGALLQDHSVNPPEPYRSPGSYRHASRFGFIAYPDDYIAGLRTSFIVNDSNTIFRRRLTGDIRASDKTPPGPLAAPGFVNWPSDDDLKAHWQKLD